LYLESNEPPEDGRIELDNGKFVDIAILYPSFRDGGGSFEIFDYPPAAWDDFSKMPQEYYTIDFGAKTPHPELILTDERRPDEFQKSIDESQPRLRTLYRDIINSSIHESLDDSISQPLEKIHPWNRTMQVNTFVTLRQHLLRTLLSS